MTIAELQALLAGPPPLGMGVEFRGSTLRSWQFDGPPPTNEEWQDWFNWLRKERELDKDLEHCNKFFPVLEADRKPNTVFYYVITKGSTPPSL